MAATHKADWFWSDWSGDQAVRRLSPAERGVWIDLLALAAVGKPTGYVCDAKGGQLPLGEIARFTNCADLDELAELVDGILEKGAASRDRTGRLFNRRMVRDAALSAKRARAGREGAAVTNLKLKDNPDLPQQNARQNGRGEGLSSSTPPPQFELLKEEPGSARASDWPRDAAEQFWARYPHKVGKRDALQALAAARSRTAFAEFMAGLERYVAKTDDRPWCNPATWIRQDRWSDQPAISPRGAGDGQHRETGNGGGGARPGGNGRGFSAIALDRARAAAEHS